MRFVLFICSCCFFLEYNSNLFPDVNFYTHIKWYVFFFWNLFDITFIITFIIVSQFVTLGGIGKASVTISHCWEKRHLPSSYWSTILKTTQLPNNTFPFQRTFSSDCWFRLLLPLCLWSFYRMQMYRSIHRGVSAYRAVCLFYLICIDKSNDTNVAAVSNFFNFTPLSSLSIGVNLTIWYT